MDSVAQTTQMKTFSSGGWKFEIRVPAYSGSGEDSLACRRLPCHASSHGGEGESSGLMTLLRRALIPLEGPTLMTSSKPNCFLKAPPPNTITWWW